MHFVFDERDPAALRTLMAWKSAQYRRTGRRDQFAQEWITRLVGRLARTGAGCTGTLSVLYADGRPVSAHFRTALGDGPGVLVPGVRPGFIKYSPGLVLHLRMAEAATGQGISMLDMGRSSAEYKDALKTGDLPVYEGAATRVGVGRRAAPRSAASRPPRARLCATGPGWRRWRYGR